MDTFTKTIRSANKEFPKGPLILCDWGTGKPSPLKGLGTFSHFLLTMMVNQSSKEEVQLTSELSPWRDILQH